MFSCDTHEMLTSISEAKASLLEIWLSIWEWDMVRDDKTRRKPSKFDHILNLVDAMLTATALELHYITKFPFLPSTLSSLFLPCISVNVLETIIPIPISDLVLFPLSKSLYQDKIIPPQFIVYPVHSCDSS